VCPCRVFGTTNHETKILDNPVYMGALVQPAWSHIPLITVCSSNKHMKISFLYSNVLFTDAVNCYGYRGSNDEWMNEFVCMFEENLSSATLSTKNPTWTGLRPNLGRCSLRLGTKCLSHHMAQERVSESVGITKDLRSKPEFMHDCTQQSLFVIMLYISDQQNMEQLN